MFDCTVLTIFPRIFDSFLNFGNPARAVQKDLLHFETLDVRDFTTDRHRSTDDYPYGGGTGMIMKPEPVVRAIRHVRLTKPDTKVVLMTPQGRIYQQSMAEEFAKEKGLAIVCGRYEGIDERIRRYVDDEITIGDYILSGGEIAAMVVLDAIVRLIPGVMGADSHIEGESFYNGLLEYPQYTRPRDFEGLFVPEILLEGHHLKIREWRRREAIKRTLKRRPDLLNRDLDSQEKAIITELRSKMNISEVKGTNESN